jgi:hypothetical protein
VTATMDADWVEILTAEVVSMWRSPIGRDKLAAWRRTFKPDAGLALDPHRAVNALLALKHSSPYRTRRPSIKAFLRAYGTADTAEPLSEPDDVPVSPKAGVVRVGRCRALLAAGQIDS